MNAVEIEEAVSALVEQPFDPEEFPYTFLQAFGNKETTLRKLRSTGSSSTNKSDAGGVLQRSNIHLAVAPAGEVSRVLGELRASPATARHKVKFILATDGEMVEAEELAGGEPLACAWRELPDHFGFFLPLAGITTVREIRENAFDIRATSKLNKLYLALLKENPDWGTEERRPEMNHFMARLIFSFFAEDTGIFAESGLFTRTVGQMSAPDSSNTHEVIGAVFRAMDTRHAAREEAGTPRWALSFPYVNGGLFSGRMDVPRFSRIARSYLLQVGTLDWKQVNPDIFGSMIQAVADDEERGALGMHYTSVPNILKMLNPLFLDDLRSKLEEAGDNSRKLLNLRNRMSRIRVFDPACGSGNFLVIAYKEMRAIEHEINRRRGEAGRRSEIPLTNFRGIELRDFAAEIARLALIIAEFQADELYLGQKEAIREFLPLDAENWITCGNALRLDWLTVCPPTGTSVRLVSDDLFETPLDQPEVDFENAGGETYICGNPPYQGSVNQSVTQKVDMALVFTPYLKAYKDLDYVAAWFVRAAEYAKGAGGAVAFVATNSVCQGEQVAMLWPILFRLGHRIAFAHTSFPWRNSAAHNAGVTCVILGLRADDPKQITLYDADSARTVASIGPYLVPGSECIVFKRSSPIADLPVMVSGNKATDAGNLLLHRGDVQSLVRHAPEASRFVRRLEGSREFIRGVPRWCLWIDDAQVGDAIEIPMIAKRLEAVAKMRSGSRGAQANAAAGTPHRFVYAPHAPVRAILIPSVSSERRPYLPCGYFDDSTVIVAPNLVLYGAALWTMAMVSSRLHLVWIATVCGKMKTDFRYSNTLGWNTFPVPTLTDQNRADLTRCAEDILLTREVHYPATIAELYDPERMPADLREAHERNDEVLERIYIGRRFRNDTERLEKLFDMYTKMTASEQRPARARRARR